MTELQLHWQEIAFMMLAAWNGWLSLQVFQNQSAIRVIEMQLAIRNGEDMQELKAKVAKLDK